MKPLSIIKKLLITIFIRLDKRNKKLLAFQQYSIQEQKRIIHGIELENIVMSRDLNSKLWEKKIKKNLTANHNIILKKKNL